MNAGLRMVRVVQAQACRAVRLSTIEVEGLGVRD